MMLIKGRSRVLAFGTFYEYRWGFLSLGLQKGIINVGFQSSLCSAAISMHSYPCCPEEEHRDACGLLKNYIKCWVTDRLSRKLCAK